MAISARFRRLLFAGFGLFVGVLLLREVLVSTDDSQTIVPTLSRYLNNHFPASSGAEHIEEKDRQTSEHEASQHAVHETEELLPASPPAAKKLTKTIIASTQSKNNRSADWVMDLLPDWAPAIFMTDVLEDALDEHGIRKFGLYHDSGREASVYLSYIINNYYNLPDIMVFIHGGRYQTHNDDPMYDTYPEIANLNLDYVLEEGYVTLRCNWKICPATTVEPVLGHEDTMWESHGLWAQAFSEFFPNETIPDKVSSPCCAQFAVTREMVHRWPVTKYEQMRQFMWKETGWNMVTKMGIVFEYMWHVIFGKPAYWCAPAKECYCKKWNFCDLDCPTEGWCRGRIWAKDVPGIFPLVAKFPEGWPQKGQDGVDWPYEGWEKDPEVAKNH
ncbi:hypothetical protein LTR10_014573 [Elasticomyces elasticus]|uniref:Uncharacterized protein n=1 Tax=Exophiala sideris TaxID=1016849 RepID=A0ABR0JSY7_9EURO|nr:hypothetical protein LTR10_014573 [Elasticomyces elasticus]KAK5040551.1 hypothetical protein LTS07_001049 [Exophiala sideris]KAK5043024.1 hypothetical protein LTR13_000795 [Exophiala sideris]KAK5068929.1 hypothetical protein LTR69_001050 [Exophiala sideris]KAK5186526.1 hypothetical protein LTR44_001582 [Eurotiomycetes sp. CCFEE 6388]